MWGPYPALIFKRDSVIHGMIYEIRRKDYVELLKRYETIVYKLHGCYIKLPDGKTFAGMTFVWNSNKRDLRTGTFDLKAWQMQQSDLGQS